jgi:cytochrome o ubiquinol oxidase subunit 2
MLQCRRLRPFGCGNSSAERSPASRFIPGVFRAFVVLPLAGLLAGCNAVLLNPSGDIALQQRNLIIVSTVLMLLIIIPVIVFTFIFAWRYRASNTDAVYDPEWHHSTRLEVLIWSAPLVIIIALGAITWLSTHTLDPYRPLTRIDASRPLPRGVKPLNVEVVALDWKWLFFYPDHGIATVNEMAAPVDVPIAFKITASSVWNTFVIPALAGMIYAMPRMETQLHAVINKEGEYDGYSGHYSGSGFSRMHFRFIGTPQEGFDQWVAKVKAQGTALDRKTYLELDKPSEQEPVRYYSSYEKGLFEGILNLCAAPGTMCANEMMHIDAMGGAGVHSHENRERLEYDSSRVQFHEPGGATTPASGRPSRSEEQPEGMKPDALSPQAHQPGVQPGAHSGHDAPSGRQAPPTSGQAPPSGKIQIAPAQLNVRPAGH